MLSLRVGGYPGYEPFLPAGDTQVGRRSCWYHRPITRKIENSQYPARNTVYLEEYWQMYIQPPAAVYYYDGNDILLLSANMTLLQWISVKPGKKNKCSLARGQFGGMTHLIPLWVCCAERPMAGLMIMYDFFGILKPPWWMGSSFSLFWQHLPLMDLMSFRQMYVITITLTLGVGIDGE